MKLLIRKLQEWHWLHTWSKWTVLPPLYVYYAGITRVYAIVSQQNRMCEICGKQQKYERRTTV